MSVKILAISKWIEAAPDSAANEFRKAVHIILLAVAISQSMRPIMAVKGAILLGIKYKVIRHTRDIDFSTGLKRKDIDISSLLDDLARALVKAGESLNYGLDCRIQKIEVKPNNEDASFPTLRISIGYAYKSTPKHKRLIAGHCSDVVQFDLSFNEPNVFPDELFDLDGSEAIRVYSLQDFTAEKFRAIIQQPVRNRYRRQDAYDLFCLIEMNQICSMAIKEDVLKSLHTKSLSRGIMVTKESLDDPEVIRRSEKDYSTLEQEIEGELPPFKKVYNVVKSYYKSLPWK
jgi:hypothetical protein